MIPSNLSTDLEKLVLGNGSAWKCRECKRNARAYVIKEKKLPRAKINHVRSSTEKGDIWK